MRKFSTHELSMNINTFTSSPHIRGGRGGSETSLRPDLCDVITAAVLVFGLFFTSTFLQTYSNKPEKIVETIMKFLLFIKKMLILCPFEHIKFYSLNV